MLLNIFNILIITFIYKMNTKEKRQLKKLPEKISLGYCSWGQTDDMIIDAVKNGLNIVIWFSIDMTTDPVTKKPKFARGPDYKKVASQIKKMKQQGYTDVIHLISIGGWNSPHVSVLNTAEEYYEEFERFNKEISTEDGFFEGFDGIDWDIEGNDKLESPYNKFTFAELDLMGEFSQIMKDNGYIVSMAPSESYVDYRTDEYSLNLTYCHKEWQSEAKNFFYHGKNVYTYLIKKYEKTYKDLDTFDFISIQLYEGYSHALHDYTRKGISFADILYNLYNNITNGYEVDFSQEKGSGMGRTLVQIDKSKLVIGLANGWAKDRFLFVNEEDIINAYKALKAKGGDVRGFMYWDIADEGKIPEGGHEPFYMSKVFNKLFNIRK